MHYAEVRRRKSLQSRIKAENGKLFSEIREIRDLRSLAIQFSLFSLNSLNSLYSLLPGIVFDTREGWECFFCFGAVYSLVAGYRFRYRCLCGVHSFCCEALPFVAGYRFRYPRGVWGVIGCVGVFFVIFVRRQCVCQRCYMRPMGVCPRHGTTLCNSMMWHTTSLHE